MNHRDVGGKLFIEVIEEGGVWEGACDSQNANVGQVYCLLASIQTLIGSQTNV